MIDWSIGNCRKLWRSRSPWARLEPTLESSSITITSATAKWWFVVERQRDFDIIRQRGPPDARPFRTIVHCPSQPHGIPCRQWLISLLYRPTHPRISFPSSASIIYDLNIPLYASVTYTRSFKESHRLIGLLAYRHDNLSLISIKCLGYGTVIIPIFG